MVKVYDRSKKDFYTEEQYGEKKLKILYHTAFGRFFLKRYFSKTIYSKKNAEKENAPESVKKIPAFIEKNHICMEDFEEKEYASFNDFFTRKIKEGKRPVDSDPNSLIAPADSKLLVYSVSENTEVKVKGNTYSLEELFLEKDMSREFAGGLCLVFRLSVDDYHRYCYIDRGKKLFEKNISGRLHTVSSISQKYRIFAENHRIYAYQETEHFGKVAYMEVGAMQVGKICNHPMENFEKGTEKGYFEYGGSTIVLCLRKDIVTIAPDILEMSDRGIETKVKYGEKIGERKC